MTEELQNNEEDGQPIGAMADHNSSVTVSITVQMAAAVCLIKKTGRILLRILCRCSIVQGT